MSATPLVSVLLPVRNGDRTVGGALQSILGQTLTDLEVIVVDDASTDSTAEVVGRSGDARVRLLRLKRRHGIASALNAAAEVARAPFLARQDADDVSIPERLERQSRLLMSEPAVGVLGTWYRQVSADGTTEVCHPTRHDELMSVALERRQVPLCHPSVLTRTELFRALGGYRAFPAAQDQDLWWRAAERTTLQNLPEVLYVMNDGDNRVSVQKRVEQFWSAHAAYVLATGRAQGRPDPLGQRPSPKAVAEFIDSARRGAGDEVRGELLGKLYNCGIL